MAVWDPHTDSLEYDGDIEEIQVILWKGHCSVHQNFTVKIYRECTEKSSGYEYYCTSGMLL